MNNIWPIFVIPLGGGDSWGHIEFKASHYKVKPILQKKKTHYSHIYQIYSNQSQVTEKQHLHFGS
jgi:hypothetical protein